MKKKKLPNTGTAGIIKSMNQLTALANAADTSSPPAKPARPRASKKPNR